MLSGKGTCTRCSQIPIHQDNLCAICLAWRQGWKDALQAVWVAGGAIPNDARYATGGQADYIRTLAGDAALDVVNTWRQRHGEPPVTHLGAITRLQASLIIAELKCSSTGTTT